MSSLRTFLAELRRRKVYQVGGVYLAVAFLVWQIADIAFPALGLPDVAVAAVLVVTALGFPLALVLAWAYEVRPDPGGREDGGASVPAAPVFSEPAERRRSSVAILPFQNMSPNPETEYFAEGVSEEITNVLAGLGELHVAARTSAYSFKGRPADVREIGSRLGVAYIVEGSVRRAGETVRVSAQLLDAETGYHVWSDRFERSLDDVFAIQDEIAGAVAGRLSEHVARETLSPRPVVRSDELPAWDAYLRGRQLMGRFEAAAVVEAAAYFTRASELDPDFAAARAGLAEALTLQSIGFQMSPEIETMPRALQEAERAVELDPELPEAHLARALVATYYEWDHPTAAAAFDRAGRLGPSVARVHMWREFHETYVGYDVDAALAANRRAQSLDPLDLSLRLREATVLYLFGRLDEAEARFRRMVAEAPELSLTHVGLADTLTRQDRFDEATRSMERAVEVGGPTVAWLGMLGLLYGLQGQTARARGVVQRLRERAHDGHVPHFWMAVALSGLGDLDAAFASLEVAVEERDSNLLYLFFVPRQAGLHDDPRFAGILRATNLGHLVPRLSRA